MKAQSMRCSAAVLAASLAVPVAASPTAYPGDPNVPIFDAFVSATVQSLHGGTLPAFSYSYGLVTALQMGIPNVTGLTPSNDWCAAHFEASMDSTGELFVQSLGGGIVIDCFLVPAQSYGAVQSLAQLDLVPGSMATYIVFFHQNFGAPIVAQRISEAGPVSFLGCSTLPNSVGERATLAAFGTSSIALNDARLQVADAPPGKPGLFFYGGFSTAVPFGDGVLCVGGPGPLRIYPVDQVGANGTLDRVLDLNAPPFVSGPGQVTPGSSWTFQFWFRDQTPTGTGFNVSDGLYMYFLP